MKRLIVCLTCLFSVCGIAFAQQQLSNYGAIVSVTDGALLSVTGNVKNNHTALFRNDDTIRLTGDFLNYASNDAFDTLHHGVVQLSGDFEEIGGTHTTIFHHLSLEGSGIKQANLDVKVNGFLYLNEHELAAQGNTIYVLKPDLNNVQTTGGFVSSFNDGGLSRTTNQSNIYLFPVGVGSPINKYRPVEFKPENNTDNNFKVGISGVDPNSESYSRDQKQTLICYLNDAFFYRLYHISGSSNSDIDFYFKTAEDGAFNNIAHYETDDLWHASDTNIMNSILGFDVVGLNTWSNFDTKAFDLAYTRPAFGNVSADTVILLGQSVALTASGGSDYLWQPNDYLDCDNCPNPVATPEQSTDYWVEISDVNKCKSIDTVHVEVYKDLGAVDLFIPDIITPNSDGFNDTWVIKDLEQFPDNEVVILNRWGDKIFEEKPYQNDFDGKLWGQNLPEATYYYMLKLNSGGESRVFNGPLTIVK